MLTIKFFLQIILAISGGDRSDSVYLPSLWENQLLPHVASVRQCQGQLQQHHEISGHHYMQPKHLQVSGVISTIPIFKHFFVLCNIIISYAIQLFVQLFCRISKAHEHGLYELLDDMYGSEHVGHFDHFDYRKYGNGNISMATIFNLLHHRKHDTIVE